MQLMRRKHRNVETMARHIAAECVALRVRRLDRLITRIFDDALRPHGIGAAQLNLLVAIAVAGPVRAVELGRALELDKSTLSRNLAVLTRNGWIEGGRDLELTAAGAQLLQQSFGSWKHAQKRLVESMGARTAGALEKMFRVVKR